MESSSEICRHRHESPVRRVRKREVRNVRLLRKYELYTVVVMCSAAHEIVSLAEECYDLPYGVHGSVCIQYARLYHVLFIQK